MNILADRFQNLIGEHLITDVTQMQKLGNEIGLALKPKDVICLIGELAAGKTTITKAIGESIKVVGQITSPTFIIARNHEIADSDIEFVHVDAYRLKTIDDFDNLDIDIRNSIVVIEWGEHVVSSLSDTWLEVKIEIIETSRKVQISVKTR